MLSFFAISFLFAGAVAAAGPVIIHLLNRRRFRVVNWAAMDFLMEASRRSRRILRWRDLLLLALRTLCVLLFGAAMARPYLRYSDARLQPDQPVHAIVVIDNSLSMGYTNLDGTLLDQAKRKALGFVNRLPRGSRISVLPLCGPASSVSYEPYRTRGDAASAVQAVRVVDRQASLAAAAALINQAAAHAEDLPAKRAVLIGDQQQTNWTTGAMAALESVPELQLVHVAATEPENAWVADLQIRDGLADVETTSSILATVRYVGLEPRRGVQVSLNVDGNGVASQLVDLEPGQTREVEFRHRFDVLTEPGRPTFAEVSVSIPPDQLTQDDHRHLTVAVLTDLPVVFVDQYGPAKESLREGRYGETYQLRQLLAPGNSAEGDSRFLVQVRHAAADSLVRTRTPDDVSDVAPLDDARLVVVAGVSQLPPETVQLLREYVQQGGQLLLAAGGEFDTTLWQQSAWLDGQGILPTPLKSVIGATPAEAINQLHPFRLNYQSLDQDRYFVVENEDAATLEDMFRQPLFFKAVAAGADDKTLDAIVGQEEARITEQRGFLVAQAERAQREAQGLLSDEELALREADRRRLATIAPAWLLWRKPEAPEEQSPQKLAALSRPRVRARYDNGAPFLVERTIGQGRVIWISSGVFSGPDPTLWNTLSQLPAVYVYDRIMRSMIETTLPQRNWTTSEPIQLPIEPAQRRGRFTLTRPEGLEEVLEVEALSADQYGLTVRDAVSRGHYQVVGRRAASADQVLDTVVLERPLAVNGPSEESDLTPLGESQFSERLEEEPDVAAKVKWIGAGEAIAIESAQTVGQQSWWRWALVAVVLLLLVELLVLAWPRIWRRAQV